VEKPTFSHILRTGFAMFSMFFGAGNVVFPLNLGLMTQDQNIFALFGLLITAVLVPFLGLLSMTLYDGQYPQFFARMGKIPGFLIALVIMGLIGPFGAIPRCIALSYSTSHLFFPSLPLELFSILACLVILVFTLRPSSILDVLGYYLTPILLIALGIIIFKGVLFAPEASPSPLDPFSNFIMGFTEGYQTMDLLGALFFSSVVILCLKGGNSVAITKDNHRSILLQTLGASAIGAALLSSIYIGFSYVSALNSTLLAGIAKDQLLGYAAIEILGPYAGIVACVAVALACLTTAIALAVVSAEYIHIDLTFGKVPYWAALTATLAITYFVSTLHFDGIVKMLAPILEVCYPALILLAILNLLYKLYGFKMVKTPVYAVFVLTLFFKFFWA
jgi:LIVCS family branched-chain amino acid:cation transporter